MTHPSTASTTLSGTRFRRYPLNSYVVLACLYFLSVVKLSSCTPNCPQNGQDFTLFVQELVVNFPDLTTLICDNEGITGTIPSELGELVSLEELDLSDNYIEGGIPSELRHMAALKLLDLDSNRLSTGIPSELAELRNLTKLKLSDNYMRGVIPTVLGELTMLTDLDIHNNYFSGSVPRELGKLESLKSLKLWDNSLIGSIPSQLGNLANLELFWLDRNELTGSIPTQLGKLVLLVELDLEKNNLNGTIPNVLGKLTRLIGQLDLHDNHLSGIIPSELGELLQVEQLELQDNYLTGTIPATLGNMQSLEYLDLEVNFLKGKIPSQLGQLSKLKDLWLYNNKLTGSVPSQLGTLLNLEWLSLWVNELTGSLPKQLGRLEKLIELDVSRNMLTGEIPSEYGNFQEIERIWFAKNRLTGYIPTELHDLSTLTILELFSNNLNIDKDFIERAYQDKDRYSFLALGKNNFAPLMTCDRKLLTWYPNKSSVIDDRTQIECEDVNLYGELRLVPHVLRVDLQAPETHAILLPEEFTAHSVFVKWSYNSSITNENVTQEDRANIKNCKDFIIQSYIATPGPELLGFKISWNNNELCVLADELKLADITFGYNITTLKPAAGYRINILPFYLRMYQNLGKLDFGIQSKTLKANTDDAKPEVAPTNLRVSYRTDKIIDLTWDEISPDMSNGKIIQYNVQCLGCGRISTYSTNSNFVSINGMNAETKYTFSVNAETTAGEGPQSPMVEFRTCNPNTYSLVSEGRCKQTLPGYFKSEPIDDSISCSSFLNEIDQELCAVGNISAEDLVLKNGYWRPSIYSVTSIGICPKPEFCIAEYNDTVQNSDQYCATKHKGTYCSACLDGYTMSESGCIICSKENEFDARSKAIALFAFVILLIASYQARMIITANLVPAAFKAEFLKQTRDHIGTIYNEYVSTKFRIFIITAQIMVSFEKSLSVYGRRNENVFTSVIALEIDSLVSILKLHCFLEFGFYQRLLFATLFPLAVLAFFWGVYFVFHKCVTEKEKILILFQKNCSICILFSFYVYAPVSQIIIETFLCENIQYESGDLEYLRADYRLRCDSDEHQTYFIFASFMVAVYPLGILCTFVYFLQKQRENEILTYSYKDGICRWYEIYELIRRFLMTSALSILVAQKGDDSISKYGAEAYAFIMVCLSLWCLETSRPYRHQGDWLYAMFSLFILALSTQVSLWSELSVKGLSSNQNVLQSEHEAVSYSVLFWLETCMLLFAIGVDFVLRRRGNVTKQDTPKGEIINLKNATFISDNPKYDSQMYG